MKKLFSGLRRRSACYLPVFLPDYNGCYSIFHLLHFYAVENGLANSLLSSRVTYSFKVTASSSPLTTDQHSVQPSSMPYGQYPYSLLYVKHTAVSP
jgi:hypothetical protein